MKQPVFEGWTVDERLRQFYKIRYSKPGAEPDLDLIHFDSDEGMELYYRYLEDVASRLNEGKVG